jgi:hypothetical protein
MYPIQGDERLFTHLSICYDSKRGNAFVLAIHHNEPGMLKKIPGALKALQQ